MRSIDFYLAGGILFFYLGVENCVNGWFVTYFKSIGVMSDAFATNLAVITTAVVGLGFFFAGIYPTGVVNAGKLIKGSTTGMSILLAIAALGGIITPQIVGFLGDAMGLKAAIALLLINVVMMIVLAILGNQRSRSKSQSVEKTA